MTAKYLYSISNRARVAPLLLPIFAALLFVAAPSAHAAYAVHTTSPIPAPKDTTSVPSALPKAEHAAPKGLKPLPMSKDEQCPDPSFAVPPDQLHILFAPIFWGAMVKGTMSAEGFSHHIDVPFSKIANNLSGGVVLNLEANYDRWTAMVEGIYLKVSEDVDTNLGSVGTSTENTLLDVGAYYQIGPRYLYPTQAAKFEVLAGGRFVRTKDSLSFQDGTEVDESSSIFAPIVGARLKYNVNYRVQLWLRGDYGGFNVNDMKSTWSADLGAAYHPSEHARIGLGYRWLKLNIDKNEGKVDLLFQGPMLGFALYY